MIARIPPRCTGPGHSNVILADTRPRRPVPRAALALHPARGWGRSRCTRPLSGISPTPRARLGPSGRVRGRGCTWEGRAFAGRVRCFVEILRFFGVRQDELPRSHVRAGGSVHMGARQLILTGTRKRRNHAERSHSPRRAPLLPCAVPSSRPDRRTPPAPAGAGGEPQRQRKFVTSTYLSPILLGVDLRRMGERYVDVGKVRSRSGAPGGCPGAAPAHGPGARPGPRPRRVRADRLKTHAPHAIPAVPRGGRRRIAAPGGLLEPISARK